MSILDRIIADKKVEVAESKRLFPVEMVVDSPYFSRESFSLKEALCSSEFGIIAEFKRKSPSKGYIHENAKVSEVVSGYANSGAAACSILTDKFYFGGTADDLRAARMVTDIPLLRKDFIIDPYQIQEAKGMGADAVLLIAAALPLALCRELCGFAHELGLEVLLELHSEEELEYVHPGIDVVGVNNRNLSTFVTDIHTSFNLAQHISDCHLKISESGINSVATVRALQNAGYRGFLIGESFMREASPAQALQIFLGNDH